MVPVAAPSKPPAEKQRRGRLKSAKKAARAPKHKVVDADSADTASESGSDSDQSDAELELAGHDFNIDNGDVYDFTWTNEGPDPDAPRADNEPETANGKSNV